MVHHSVAASGYAAGNGEVLIDGDVIVLDSD
jgi:hypothetical protein